MSMELNNNLKFKNEKFVFTGQTFEYFKIWIVNIVLSILSLGIYSAWAKVRKKRYFYGNTSLAGGHFTYLAKPLQILKGRLIAVGVLVILGAFTNIYPEAEIIFSVLFFFLLPFLFISAVRFNAQNSAFQHIRFQYTASYKQALGVFVLQGILIVLTLGMSYPFFTKARQNLLMAKHKYGQLDFSFSATGWQFYKEYTGASLVFLLIMILYTGSFFIVSQKMSDVNIFSGDYISITDIVSELEESLEEEAIGEPPTFDIQLDEEITACLNADDCELSDAQVNAMVEQLAGDNKACSADTDCSRNSVDNAALTNALLAQVFGFVIGIYILLFFLYVHIAVRVTNLSLNHTQIGEHKLKSELQTLPLFFIYLFNIVAILFSLGLLIPWAQIRLARYRLSCISLDVVGDLGAVVAQEQENRSATGEEFGDFMDIDIAL